MVDFLEKIKTLSQALTNLQSAFSQCSLVGAGGGGGGYAHHIVVSKIQKKHFWLATQLYPQNDWTGWHFRVNYDVFAQAKFLLNCKFLYSTNFRKLQFSWIVP